jgi:hypothetical protein
MVSTAPRAPHGLGDRLPRENPGPKPPRAAVLSNEQIAQRVEESLR